MVIDDNSHENTLATTTPPQPCSDTGQSNLRFANDEKHSSQHSRGNSRGNSHGHSYGHSHGHGHNRFSNLTPSQAIIVVIGLTLCVMTLEFIGGWFINSLTLISDAAHMLTDLGALMLGLFAIWIAKKPSTKTLSFGYHRAEILGALTSGLAIWLIAGVLIFESFERLQKPPNIEGPWVFGIALIGLAANLISMRFLHGAKEVQINLKAAYLHLFADTLGSIGAVLAGLILWLTDWKIIDPIVTLLFSMLMLIGSWSLVKETVSILMESTPTGLDSETVRNKLAALKGVFEVHDLHIWSVSKGKTALSVHLISQDQEKTLLQTANQILESQFGIIHTTIQIENPQNFISKRCYDCSPEENLGKAKKRV